LIIVSASGKENVGKENRGFVIFLSYIFLSVGLDGRNDDHGPNVIWQMENENNSKSLPGCLFENSSSGAWVAGHISGNSTERSQHGTNGKISGFFP